MPLPTKSGNRCWSIGVCVLCVRSLHNIVFLRLSFIIISDYSLRSVLFCDDECKTCKKDIDRTSDGHVLTIIIIIMNSDPSNNPIRLQNRDYDMFTLNQFYNAVEDEQRYMNEYASMVHRYNEFITNGNVMFSRIEQTLRENLSRTVARQSFYYNSRQVPYAAPAAAAPSPAPAPAPAPTANISNTIPHLLSRYLNNELARDARQPINPNENNLFSMLYTIPLEVRRNANGAGGGGGGAGGAPTNEQVQRATMNTVFGNIISPVNATCPISRDEFNDESEITMIRSCNHIFNRASLREWFVNHSTCPMCRSDIREYRPATAAHLPERRRRPLPSPQQQQQQQPPRTPANLSIDRIDNNEFTFSYDLPVSYNDNQIYQDIVNTVNHMTNNHRRNDPDDDDDIMEVD